MDRNTLNYSFENDKFRESVFIQLNKANLVLQTEIARQRKIVIE